MADFEYSDSQCVFLSDTISYLRLEGEVNNILLINRSDMRKIFEESFEAFWNYDEEVVERDRTIVEAYMQHVIRGIHLEGLEDRAAAGRRAGAPSPELPQQGGLPY